jgi:hypothetical protein
MKNANTTINWKNDSFDAIHAKQELVKFLQEQNEMKGKSERIDAYHERRINELTEIINKG